MDKYIFRDFAAVRDWVTTNKLCRYNFRAGRPNSDDKNNFIFAYDEEASPEENLQNLEAQLESQAGRHIWGIGWRKPNTTVGGIVCEVEYGKDDEQLAQIKRMLSGQGVGYAQPVSEEQMEAKLTEKIMMKIRLEQMEKERKDFEKERKEFEAEKAGFIGVLIDKFGPVVSTYLQKQQLAKVAGTDVQAERITPVSDAPEEEADPNELPDEEATQAYELLKRFRMVEPNYLQLLESVVTMAENGNQMYITAKSLLLK